MTYVIGAVGVAIEAVLIIGIGLDQPAAVAVAGTALIVMVVVLAYRVERNTTFLNEVMRYLADKEERER